MEYLTETINEIKQASSNIDSESQKVNQLLTKSSSEPNKKITKVKRRTETVDREIPVPPKLIKYLGLIDDATVPRFRIMGMLYDKFKADGLREGSVTTLDDKTANVLGKDINRVIEFNQFQNFLKEFYDEAFPSSFDNTIQL